MHALRRLLAVSAAAVVAVASGVLGADAAPPTPSVYNTPGAQISQGRLWNTTCEKYSSNVVRCRTNIWATTVRYNKGRYVKRTGWTFNNLTYLPSPRASWVTNNLGRNNPGWTSGGRQWRTECDTAATGRGGCRSFMLVDVVRPARSGYVTRKQWVFNNMVLFSSSSIPAVTQVPAHILDQSRLGFTGLGPIHLGASMKDLATLGYLKYPGECDGYGDTKVLTDRGIKTYGGAVVTAVLVNKDGVQTVDGAHVGMTFAQVKAIYGDRIAKVVMNDPVGAPVPTAVVRSGGKELVFTATGYAPITDSARIQEIVARALHQGYPYGYEGC